METSIIIWIGIGCMALIIFVIVVAILTHKRQMLELENEKQFDIFKASAEAQEMQKAKISGNMHDQLVPKILLIGKNIDHYLSTTHAEALDKAVFKQLVRDINEAAEETRLIAHNLSPRALMDFGLIAALQMHVDKLNYIDGSTATFNNESAEAGNFGFSEADQLNIYLVCTELLNNALKHGAFTDLTVRITSAGHELVIIFSHNGIPVSNAGIEALRTAKGSFGLKSLQSRLLLLNGRVDYSFDEIATIKLYIPVIKNA